MAVLADKEGELRKMTFFMEDLTPKLCLRHLPIEMRWDYAVKRPITLCEKLSTHHPSYPRYVVLIVDRDKLHRLRQPDLNFDDIVYVTFLYGDGESGKYNYFPVFFELT